MKNVGDMMRVQVGYVEAMYRYPVKSMRGESLTEASLGWHGFEGDRRLALRKMEDQTGFPWLTASKLPELILYSPQYLVSNPYGLPSHVRIPRGDDLPIFSPELASVIGARLGQSVSMMHLDRGIFDVASLSIITTATVDEVSARAGIPADIRRFRPNLVIQSTGSWPFEEDGWVGGRLSFGDGDDGPAIVVTQRDERCAMVCFDPDTAESDPKVLRTIVQVRDNHLGVYASVIRRGRIVPGQAVFFHPP